MMEMALAARSCTIEQIKPMLEPRLDEVFMPQAVSAYATTEILSAVQKKHPGYSYKEATLNPTNPRDRLGIVQEFRRDGAIKELISERGGATGRVLYMAKPIQITDTACLSCHIIPAAAPASMLKIYGEANGFGWKHNEIAGAQVVTVPMEVPIQNADRALKAFLIPLAGVFVLVFVVLNIQLSWMIVRPIRRMSQAADQASTGDFDVPEFAEGGRDEVAVLGGAFTSSRIMLDTGDGAAICFLGDPEEALVSARLLRDLMRQKYSEKLSMRVGLHLGPLRLL